MTVTLAEEVRKWRYDPKPIYIEAVKLRMQGYSAGDVISQVWSKYPRANARTIEKTVNAAFAVELEPLRPILDPKAWADELADKLSESRLADIVKEVETRLNALRPDAPWMSMLEWLRTYKQKGILELCLLYWISEASDDDGTVKLVKQRIAVLLKLDMHHVFTEDTDIATGHKVPRLYLSSLWLNATIRKMINRQIVHPVRKCPALYRVDEGKRLEREAEMEQRFRKAELPTQDGQRLLTHGRPPKSGTAMSQAERARQYRARRSSDRKRGRPRKR